MQDKTRLYQQIISLPCETSLSAVRFISPQHRQVPPCRGLPLGNCFKPVSIVHYFLHKEKKFLVGPSNKKLTMSISGLVSFNLLKIVDKCTQIAQDRA